MKRAEGGKKINKKSSCQGAADMTESKQKQAELRAVSAVHFFSWLMSGEAALYVFSFFVSVLPSLCFSP